MPCWLSGGLTKSHLVQQWLRGVCFDRWSVRGYRPPVADSAVARRYATLGIWGSKPGAEAK